MCFLKITGQTGLATPDPPGIRVNRDAIYTYTATAHPWTLAVCVQFTRTPQGCVTFTRMPRAVMRQLIFRAISAFSPTRDREGFYTNNYLKITLMLFNQFATTRIFSFMGVCPMILTLNSMPVGLSHANPRTNAQK